MWYHVIWPEFTDASKEYTASIFRDKSKLRWIWEDIYQGMKILMRTSADVTAAWDDREESVWSYQLPFQSRMFLHTKGKQAGNEFCNDTSPCDSQDSFVYLFTVTSHSYQSAIVLISCAHSLF
jgi:hypothetical protein